MSQHTTAAMYQPRGDTRLLDDIVYGLDGYWAILVAYDLKLFPLLAEKSCTLHEVCEALRLAPRPAAALLTVCTAQGLLQVQDHQYALTPLAEDYLLETSPTYFGTVFDLWIRNAAISSFTGVKQAMLTNAPQVYGGGDMFKSHEEHTHLARTFTRAMHSNSIGPALVWPDLLDLSRHRLLLDIGGGSGAHCIGAIRRWSNLHAIVFDLAPVCEVAEEFITQASLQHRIRTQVSDMWQHPFPPADLHFYGQIYHDWPPEKCQWLTQKSFESLEAGGRIIIHEKLLNDNKTGPFAIAAFSISILLWTEGQQYSGGELSAMLTAAGFTDIEVKPTSGYWSIVTGRKP
jgi:O-methyltransferase/methyltransferase family protein